MREQQSHLRPSHEARCLLMMAITLSVLLNKRRPETESLPWGHLAVIGSQPHCTRLVPSPTELFLWVFLNLYSSKTGVGHKLTAKVCEQSEESYVWAYSPCQCICTQCHRRLEVFWVIYRLMLGLRNSLVVQLIYISTQCRAIGVILWGEELFLLSALYCSIHTTRTLASHQPLIWCCRLTAHCSVEHVGCASRASHPKGILFMWSKTMLWQESNPDRQLNNLLQIWFLDLKRITSEKEKKKTNTIKHHAHLPNPT